MSDNRRVGQRNSASSNLRSSPSYTCVACHVYRPNRVCVSVSVHGSGPCVTTRNESKTRRPCRPDETPIRLLSHSIPRRFVVCCRSMVNIVESPMFLFCNVTLRFEIRLRLAPVRIISFFSKRPGRWTLKYEIF